MLPYIDLGRFSVGPIQRIPTFGLLMMLAFIAGFIALQAEIKRRKLAIDPHTVVTSLALAGILGAKIWHILDTPDDRPSMDLIFSLRFFPWFQQGFAWFGGLVAGIATLLYLARKYRVSMLAMLDVASAPCALGYAVGRIGCLISGDGDYGIPTSLPWGMAFPNGLVPTTDHVHPTPIYEFIAGVLIFWYLWRRGTRALQHPLAVGVITSEFFILSGIARFLVEFVRINPRVVLGMSNAQFTGLLSAGVGVAMLVVVRRRFRRINPVHRVFDHVNQYGNPPKPEYHRPTPECPNPERWSMFDTMTAEVEVLEFLKCLMTTMKPSLVVETGTFLAVSTLYMAEGMKQNGMGKIITCEPDPAVFAKAKEKIDASGLKKWVDYRCEESLKLNVPGTIDILFCDSLPELREAEVRYFLPKMNPNGLILMHDASSHLKTVREAALRLEQEGLVSVVLLPTPRGLVIAQKRAGRS